MHTCSVTTLVLHPWCRPCSAEHNFAPYRNNQAPDGWKPRSALLMRDREDAIETAWNACKWEKVTSTARCSTHSKWNVSKQKMQNGEPFGPQRADAWSSLVFKTCVESFQDGVGYYVKLWEKKGDKYGAVHLQELAQTSDAPLCKWTPVACPFVASGAGESLNQMFKSTPKTGQRRKKLTLLQMVCSSVCQLLTLVQTFCINLVPTPLCRTSRADPCVPTLSC